MRVGAQLYTIRNYTQTEEALELAFKKLAQIGFKWIQVSGIGNIDPYKVRALADAYKLGIVITHTNPKEILEDTEAVIKKHEIYGCQHIGIGSMPQGYERDLIGIRKFIKDYTEVAKKLQARGMKLHYHNHGFEFEKFEGKLAYDVLIHETDPVLWGFIPDTFWIQFAGINAAKQLIALKDRVVACHFKDLTMKGHKQIMAPVMEGNLCFEEIIAACEIAHIAYAMIEQDDCNGEDPFNCLERSFVNLRKVGVNE